MCRSTFLRLSTELKPFIERQDTHLRSCISVEQRLAVTLWRLATTIEYRTLSELFGIGRSTACTIVLETCRAIQNLIPKYVTVPKGEQMSINVEGFEARWGFPQTAGAIDGTHIPILKPKGNSGPDYYNRKGFYSIVMQAVVDFRGRFMDIYLGWPGKVHDARVFSNSSLYAKGQAGTLLPDTKRRLGGVEVPLVILGDPAYPALPWLMKGYPEHLGMPVAQKTFNYRLSRARMVVENAFGRLKGRWRCLMKRNDCEVNHVIAITSACVVLHNFCEIFDDDFQEEWMVEETPSATGSIRSTPTSSAGTMRDAICRHIEQSQ